MAGGDDEGRGPDPGEVEAPGRRSLRELEEHRSRDLRRRFLRDRSYRRAMLAGIAVSAVAHLLLLFVLSREVQLPRMSYRARPPSPAAAEGLRLVRVEPPDRRSVAAPPEAPPPRETPAPEEPQEDTEEERTGEPTPVPSEEEGTEEEGLTNAERLTPREGDSRVWKEFWDEDLRNRYLGGSARADSAIRAILGEYVDSLKLAREAYRNARDWTVGEGDERWGVSSEGLHLGDITIPLPVGQLFQPTGPRRRQLERELRELREIQRQERLGDVQETREERIEEMRKRSREEAEKRTSDPDSTDTGGESR